ncbi:MAG: DUF1015 domain-containing protein [Ruminococcaceae bacterium]|nr:DUF1015 domain-containing protein [Oscillospiraceae bacterium]
MKNCFKPADILLPEFAADAGKMHTWACVACDQYTSEPEYWNDVEAIVGDAPSTLRITLPELYLSDAAARIPAINAAMDAYMAQNVLCEHKNTMIYLERRQKNGKIRRGLVGAIDLECYDYNKGAKSLVRATEGTVLERIPPRVKIREGAPVELPHIMILIDDPAHTVIEPLIGNTDALAQAYDFDLMKNGGHASGWFLSDPEIVRVTDALEALCASEAAKQDCENPLVFAMGDGNHSLASAKAFWEQTKAALTEAERASHPARYALCEIVNIHDEALEFEPIYRVVFGVKPDALISELAAYLDSLPASDIVPQSFEVIAGEKSDTLTAKNPTSLLPVGTLQTFLDAYIKAHDGVSVDYIHGVESTRKLASAEDAVGFLFEGMGKSELFPTVVRDGALPRKTFSMGEADDKRFYLEARKIK